MRQASILTIIFPYSNVANISLDVQVLYAVCLEFFDPKCKFYLINTYLMDSGFSLTRVADFYRKDTQWTGTDSPYSFTAALLFTIFIYFSQNWNTRKYKDWVTLSAGSTYMLFFFLYPWLPQFWQHKALLPPHKRTHTHKQCFLFHMSKCEALPGLSTIASVTLLFSPSVGRPSLFWQLCFWYLYFYRILITLCFIFHASPL